MQSAQPLIDYELEDVRRAVEPVRKSRRLPPRTLSYWMHRLGIYRDDRGFYCQSDVELLKDLARWLYHPRHTIDQFIDIKKQQGTSNAARL